jgi:hypothetical protein
MFCRHPRRSDGPWSCVANQFLNHGVTGSWDGQAPSQPAPVADADNCNSSCARWHNLFVADLNIDDNAVLRIRICGHAACRAVFTICVSCDRGQRYCSLKCRSEVRRRQRHDANRRYQQSELGRDSHRRCQQRYRERAPQPPVTDQGIEPIPTPPAYPDSRQFSRLR